MLGRRIADEFDLLESLREDSSGIVYRARQVSLQRDVVLKLLHSGMAVESVLERFRADARLLASLNHLNVTTVYMQGTHEGTPFVVTELVQGISLRQFAQSERSRKERLQIMTGVAAGLRAIHSLDVVHGNLSPDNIIVSGRVAKIGDLGVAKRIAGSSMSSKDHLRNLDYASPEHVTGTRLTTASDLFTFGVILYELLAEKHPFQAEHPVAVLYNVLHRQPPQLTQCGTALADCVMRCLRKEAKERPQSIVEVEGILQGALESLPVEMVEVPVRPQFAASAIAMNPYLSRTMIRRPEQFFGREREVRRVFALLDADPPASVSIVGDRRIGKSSLLNFVYQPSNRVRHLRQPERMVMAFLDLQQKDMTVESFARLLIGTTRLEAGDLVDLSDCSHDLDGIREMVIRMQKLELRLVVILDEFERLAGTNFTLGFFGFLRHLANNYDVAYVTSSMHDLPSLCHDKAISESPFFNFFTTIRLSAFEFEEAKELIRRPSAEVGRPLEPHADRILDLSGLFPFFIQLACSHALELLGGGGDLDLLELRHSFKMEARPHYQAIWESLGATERTVLSGIARSRKIPPSARDALDALAARNYILVGPSGDRLFSSPMEEFVLAAVQHRHTWRRFRRPALIGVATLLALMSFYGFALRAPILKPSGYSASPISDPSSPALAQVRKPIDLFLLSVGVSRYKDLDHRLDYAAADAQEIVAAFKEQDTLFNVAPRLLVDDKATRAAVIQNLAWLQRSATQHDLVVLTLSGHGRVDQNDVFFFLPYDYDPNLEVSLSAISKQVLLDYLRKLPCKVLLMLDTCNSGEMTLGNFKGVDIERSLARAVDDAIKEFSSAANGIIVMAACLSREKAEESASWGHGALTLAFLEGMRGKRLYSDRGQTKLPHEATGKEIIYLNDLDYYVTKRVQELVGGDQHVKTTPLTDVSLSQIPIAFRKRLKSP